MSNIFFNGVPVPSGAGIILLPVIISFANLNIVIDNINFYIIIVLVASFLMISKIPTYSQNHLKYQER